MFHPAFQYDVGNVKERQVLGCDPTCSIASEDYLVTESMNDILKKKMENKFKTKMSQYVNTVF